MHKFSINLHNLKTALIFSMEISRDYLSRLGLPNYINFWRSAARDPKRGGGVESTPPPHPGCEMGSKDPTLGPVNMLISNILLVPALTLAMAIVPSPLPPQNFGTLCQLEPAMPLQLNVSNPVSSIFFLFLLIDYFVHKSLSYCSK